LNRFATLKYVPSSRFFSLFRKPFESESKTIKIQEYSNNKLNSPSLSPQHSQKEQINHQTITKTTQFTSLQLHSQQTNLHSPSSTAEQNRVTKELHKDKLTRRVSRDGASHAMDLSRQQEPVQKTDGQNPLSVQGMATTTNIEKTRNH
jgi:hypothetical protein